MSTYSNRLQPAVQNLLQRVVQFFHLRSSCTTHVSADVFGGRKSLIKPVTCQKTCNYIELFCSSTRERHAWQCIYWPTFRNNIKCIVHDDLAWKNQTTWYILPNHWLYEWFSQFHSCGTYSVISRSPSIVLAYRNNTVHSYYMCYGRLHPQYDQAMNNLGNLYKDRGRLIEGEQLLSQAVSVRWWMYRAYIAESVIVLSTVITLRLVWWCWSLKLCLINLLALCVL